MRMDGDTTSPDTGRDHRVAAIRRVLRRAGCQSQRGPAHESGERGGFAIQHGQDDAFVLRCVADATLNVGHEYMRYVTALQEAGYLVATSDEDLDYLRVRPSRFPALSRVVGRHVRIPGLGYRQTTANGTSTPTLSKDRTADSTTHVVKIQAKDGNPLGSA